MSNLLPPCWADAIPTVTATLTRTSKTRSETYLTFIYAFFLIAILSERNTRDSWAPNGIQQLQNRLGLICPEHRAHSRLIPICRRRTIRARQTLHQLARPGAGRSLGPRSRFREGGRRIADANTVRENPTRSDAKSAVIAQAQTFDANSSPPIRGAVANLRIVRDPVSIV